MNAATTISQYATPRNCAMIKAAAPMIGGMTWPPVDAAATTAPEKVDV